VELSSVDAKYRMVQPTQSYMQLFILGAFVKLRKAAIIFVMSVRPSVRLSVWKISTPTK